MTNKEGSFRLNLDYFEYCTGLTMTNGKFAELFGGPARTPEQRLTQREMDLAASVQAITEEVMLKLAAGEGLKRVEITTSPDNFASQKVIVANGGELVETFITLPSQGSLTKLRYRIALV